ncbi:MAG: FAD-dependent oxidoreductase [Flavobacteriales bacterium]|mgnify:CR=1 FL=1|nr:FAD-dependent oxidoreductase [Flavobacteriales bacterium]
MKEVEYLIVGQGIAGSVLAYQLEQRKKSFCIIDRGHKNSASYVAAGVINPLVLKRMTLSWRAGEFMAYMHDFYLKLDDYIGIKSYHRTPLNKLIHSKEEIDFWKQRWKIAELDDFADYELKEFELSEFKEKFILGTVKETAWIDLKLLLSEMRTKLKSEGKLVQEDFDHMALENHEYKGIAFDNIVFCEGSACTSNPFFDNLPFDLNRGDLLTIRAPKLELAEIYKKKVFIIPLGNDLFRIGATYQKRHEKEYLPNEKRSELLKNFEDIFNCEYEVVEQESGVRPTVKDRRPLVGRHLLLNNFYLLNGLGSRGCLMSPLLSEELIDHIENGKELSKDVQLDRFS